MHGTIATVHLNERGRGGRLVCPVCDRPIRVGQATVDDGLYRRHAECGFRATPSSRRPDARTVRIHVRARDWEDLAWRHGFEADLRRTGWRLLSVEPPSVEQPEYVYILVPEADSAPPPSP
jgi:hypothetical protein